MKKQAESFLGSHKHLKLALIVLASVLILSTSVGVIYQIWLGSSMVAVALAFVLLAEAFVVCYCNSISQIFATLDNINDLVGE